MLFRQSTKFAVVVTIIALVLSGCSDSDDDQGSAGGSGTVAVPAATTDLSSYLAAAINDEYRARDTYQGVIDTFGNVRPFTNIKRAEEQHIGWLVGLYQEYGLSVPGDSVGGLPTPTTIAASCSLGVQAEIENADMYVGLLAGTTNYPDVQDVFTRLRDASLYQHLPAFQKCAE
jgi:rubrerythrin